MSRRPSETIDQISDVRQLLEGFACGPPPSDVEAANAQSRSNQFAGAEDVKLHAVEIVRNAAAPVYYEAALQNEKGSSLTSTGALAVRSGAKTGRSPKDKRVVAETIGWTDCECSDDGTHWRTGRVLDPFAGSGTTLVAAHNESRDAIGIDIDDRNVAMVEDRLGPLVAACDLTVNTTEVAAA